MARLEELNVGSRVTGLDVNEAVTVIAVKWCGSALEVTYRRDQGQLASKILYRANEDDLQVLDNNLPWSFDADAGKMRLISEAYRIDLAHLFDPYLAVHTSAVEPLPHQITAVYQEMLPRLPLRYVLADDPGAGKTIMTGLLIKELMVRGDLKRCLIVTPGNLSEQWQDELWQRFHLRFEIMTNDRIESAIGGNIFAETDLCIARLDKLSRSESIQDKLRVTDWDLIVCDEAHKMSATVWGGETKYTKRFNLGRLLSEITRHFLLLTATPHNGKDEDFQLFMSLIDPDRFEGVHHAASQSVDVSDVMRRLTKEELLKFDGTPLFPERIAATVYYDLSPREKQLYDAVTTYVQEEFNRADKLTGERKSTVGFALTILQRRLASSPEAIYQSLHRRRERLERILEAEKQGRRLPEENEQLHFDDEEFDEDDYTAAEYEDAEEDFADSASAASTITEMEAEIVTLKHLERMANAVRASGEDRKWDELSRMLQEEKELFSPDGKREKLIIFTEHRDTLNYLTDKIRTLFGSDDAVVTIHGGLSRSDRRRVEELFKQDKQVRLLIATDAAGEGINLQRAHLMINYDLPWNPNRLEQRFGRIHRIGQTEVCLLWNLISKDTREGMVFQRLFEKLEQERAALGGKVFDILGKMTFDNRPLRDLLIQAIRYGNDPAVKEKLWQAVDNSLEREKLRELIENEALAEDTMDKHQVMRIREDMERMEAHKLQPHFIGAFFLAAFREVGGQIRPRETGRYEVTFVPSAVRNRDKIKGVGGTVLQRYERICFDKAACHIPNGLPAELICPGHPLLEATIDLLLERNADVMKRGSIFVDETDYGTEPRLLFYIEDSILDGKVLPSGTNRVISKNVHFVELKSDGTASNAGYAPYLDYRPPTEQELPALQAYVSGQNWLTRDVEDLARNYAISHIIPSHLDQVKTHRQEMVDKTKKAVEARLSAEIRYWDYQAYLLKEKEAQGKVNARLNSQRASQRADELATRKDRRLAELDAERMVSPAAPVVMGGAVIIPRGLLHRLCGTPMPTLFGSGDKKAVEYAAMRAVMDIERALGNAPEDVSANNEGYDILSRLPVQDGAASSLRFIEVKGRTKGADTITVTTNEIRTCFNRQNNYILAIVEVDGANTHTVYLKSPFRTPPEFGLACKTFYIRDLIQNSEIILEK